MMNDLISRQAALNSPVTMVSDGLDWIPAYHIKDLPSAQPERKKGRWISRDGEEDCYECSECHAVIEGDEVYWRNNYFCYHCGADMRGEDHGDK